MTQHFKVICKDCGIIISQCRCISKDKAISYGLCLKCKEQVLEEPKPIPLDDGLSKNERISKSLKGRTVPIETRMKISEAVKLHWKTRRNNNE